MDIKVANNEIKLSGMLDSNSAGEFSKAVDDILDSEAANARWTVDMSELKYTSSQGLRLLLAFQKGLKARGGALVVKSMCPTVREVFDMTALASMFEII